MDTHEFSPEMEARINAYEEKRQARIDRLNDRAQKSAQESQQIHQQWDRQSSVIPMGQPILVGHHSEGRDRRFRAKLHGMLERSFARQQDAERLQSRAAAAERNDAIFSDDPLASMKLAEKIAHLEARQAAMKRINAVCRKLKLKKGDEASLARLRQAITDGQLSEAEVTHVLRACDYHWDTAIGYPGYMLTNNNANIRRLKQRVEHIEETQEATPEQTVNGVRIVDNVEANRLQLFFPGKPSETIRKELKSAGFRWAPSEGAWQRHRSNAATYWAGEIVKKLDS